MSSVWRKKEKNKELTAVNDAHSDILIENFESINTSGDPNVLNFSNIPMFNALHNITTSKKKIIEGMNWEGTDYFQSHSKYKYNYLNDFIKMIQKFLEKLFKKVPNIDSMIEQYIYQTLLMFVLLNNIDCNKKNSVLSPPNKAKADFFWMSNQFKNIGKGVEGFTGNAFSIREQPYIFKTIDSFKINHPDFITNNDIYGKVGSYYITSLNRYETKLHRRITDDELFTFNNDFDNLLNDSTFQKIILNIKTTDEWKTQTETPESKSKYDNTEKDYQIFYKEEARFKINNKQSKIDYYPLNNIYFLRPKNESNFNTILENRAYSENSLLTRSDILKKDPKFKTQPQSNPPSPVTIDTNTTPDTNYAFSVNMTETRNDTIKNYLIHVIQLFSYIIYFKINETDTEIGFQHIEARIGTLYTDILNRIEFMNYNQYNEFLDEYQIAAFNHTFFIILHQSIILNYNYKEYGLDITTSDPNKYVKIQESNSIIMMKNIFTNCIQSINYRVNKIYTVDTYGKNFDFSSFPDNLMILDPSAVPPITPFAYFNIYNKNTIKDIEMYCADYILDKNTKIDDDMQSYYIPGPQSYYIPGPLSDCDKLKRKVQRELEKYAKIIKKEIYNLLLIPIIVYLSYNVYYLFFFRDSATPVKYDEDIYINEGKECKNPIFPCWESYFHSYENHNTDLLFEYLFKPAKMMYTVLNAIKIIPRSIIPSISNIFSIKNIPPYIYLFITIIIVINVANKHGQKISAFFYRFFINIFSFKEVPTINIWKGKDGSLKSIVTIFTYIFLILSVLKDIFGVDWHAVMNNAASNTYKTNNNVSWKDWISTPPYIFLVFFKFVVCLIYWIFKYFVSIAIIPTAIFIGVIYIFYTVCFGIYNNTDKDTDYFTKKELIDRLIFTDLYDIKKYKSIWDDAIYIFKFICWCFMVFMTEMIAIYYLYKGFIKITTNITGSPTADAIQLVLVTFYMCIFVLILLWCFYKYKFKLSVLEYFYSNQKDVLTPYVIDIEKFKNILRSIDSTKTKYELQKPNDKDPVYNIHGIFDTFRFNTDIQKYNIINKIRQADDKRFVLKKDTDCDLHERMSKNSPISILFGSDYINEEIIKEEAKKRKQYLESNPDKKYASSIDKWSKKIVGTVGEVGNNIFQLGQNYMTDLSNNSVSVMDSISNTFKGNTFKGNISTTLSDAKKFIGRTIKNVELPKLESKTLNDKINEFTRYKDKPLT